MRCEEVRRWISPYLDSELDPHTTFEIDQHVASCEACRVAFEAEERFERRLFDALASGAATEAAWNLTVSRVLAPKRSWLTPWSGTAMSIGLVLLLIGGWYDLAVTRQDLVRSAVHNHQTYLNNRMSLDVQTSSPAIIEAFFSEKLGFPVQCPRSLANHGVQLIGARLCHLKQVPVAYVLYHVENRSVSVFLLDAASLPKFRQRLESWTRAVTAYRVGGTRVAAARTAHGAVCAVGDVPADALARVIAAYTGDATRQTLGSTVPSYTGMST